mgnify:CR=1 FL=1
MVQSSRESELNKGETYTIEITGKGIKAERPLYLYTSSNMGKIYQSAKLNGVTREIFMLEPECGRHSLMYQQLF